MPVSHPAEPPGLADLPITEIVVTEAGRRAVTGDSELTDEQRALLMALAYPQDEREAIEERQDIIAALRCLLGHAGWRIRLAAEDAAYLVACPCDSFVLGR
jgi:hypothetical protein